MNRFGYAAIALLALIVAFQAQHQWRFSDASGRKVFAVHDFEAFYCGGAARDAGRDPNLTADYLDCGGRRAGHAPVRERLDTPAPLPGYDIALFALVARLPYTLAAYLWLALSAVAVFGGAILLARASTLPPLLAAAAFVVLGATGLYWGQLAAIALGALCVAAYAVETGRMRLASAALIVAAIEPHVGLPAILGAAIFLPRTRLPLGIGLVVLFGASLAGLSVHENIEYFAKTTPLQIAAEVPMNNQYSLTWLAYAFGAPAAVAIKLGSLSYAVAIVAGLWLARPVSRAIGSGAAYVLVPVACAMLGGPYIHSNQLALALLAALLIAGRSQAPEPLLWCSAALLAARWWDPSWMQHPYTTYRLESAAIVAAIAYYAVRRQARGRAAAAAAVAAAAYVAITFALLHVSAVPWDRPQSAAEYSAQIGPDAAYASGHYGIVLREYVAEFLEYSWQAIATRMPYWLGLALLIARCATIGGSPQARRFGAVAG